MKLNYFIDAGDAALELASVKDEASLFHLREVIGKIWQADKVAWYDCLACGTSFAWPFLACTVEYYNLTYYGELFYPDWKWDYEITFRQLSSMYQAGSRLLEVGAGNGAFIRRLIGTLIKPENILCTEFSGYGIEQIRSYGVQCLPVNLHELATADYREKFGIICMFQVLEHMESLDEVFETLRYLAAPGASLFIVVPNNRIRNFYDSIGEHLDWPPGHITRFSPKGLKLLAERHDWFLREHRYQSTGIPSQTLLFLDERFQKLRKVKSFVSGISLKPVRKLVYWTCLSLIALRHVGQVARLNAPSNGTSQWFWLVRKQQ